MQLSAHPTRLLKACTTSNKKLQPLKQAAVLTPRTTIRPDVSAFAATLNRSERSHHLDHHEDPLMMCYQCEQTRNNTGCQTAKGVCGKTAEQAALQDLLVFTLKGLGCLAHYARTTAGIRDAEADSSTLRLTFATLTNVQFDDDRTHEYVIECLEAHYRLSKALASAGFPLPAAPANVNWFEPETGHPLTWNYRNAARVAKGEKLTREELLDVSKHTGILHRQQVMGKTVAGIHEMIVYGLKGMAAYGAHAEALGGKKEEVYAGTHSLLSFLSGPGADDVATLLEQAMALGAENLVCMQLLSETHSGTFGNPTPAEVSTQPVPGKAILVTGHDMHDMELLLKQTEGTGIKVYTHGEMLPAHGYPGLKKYPHLAGHYGGAWFRQKADFAKFPGAILVTTNCVLDPLESYRHNMFTANETGVTGVAHLHSKDFSPLITRALELPGFTTDNMAQHIAPGNIKRESVTAGFGHHAVLSAADKVINAIQQGNLRHVFVVGGCDGHEKERAYYSQLGQDMPTDTLVLTLGCGKYRLLDHDFGTLADTGLPRLMDMGQCNDAYSAVVVAMELAKALKTDINSLPLSLDLSWFEQKAVAVLCTLLHLGVKNIRLGPTLPAFLTKEALNVLTDVYGLMPADVHNPKSDIGKMMSNA